MFRMYACNSHSYTHLILALGIVREPTVWGFNTSEYPGIHDIGLPTVVSQTWQDPHAWWLMAGCFIGNSLRIAMHPDVCLHLHPLSGCLHPLYGPAYK